MYRFGSVLVFFVLACTESGAGWQHYRISAFDEARDRGMPIALHFFDSSREECRKQKEVLAEITAQPKFKGLGAYRVQYGNEKMLQNNFGINDPCVVVVFHGTAERGRSSIGETDRAGLERLIESAMR